MNKCGYKDCNTICGYISICNECEYKIFYLRIVRATGTNNMWRCIICNQYSYCFCYYICREHWKRLPIDKESWETQLQIDKRIRETSSNSVGLTLDDNIECVERMEEAILKGNELIDKILQIKK